MGPQREGCPAGSAGCPVRPPGWHPIPVLPGSPRQPLSPEAEPHYPGAWGHRQTQNAHCVYSEGTVPGLGISD